MPRRTDGRSSARLPRRGSLDGGCVVRKCTAVLGQTRWNTGRSPGGCFPPRSGGKSVAGGQPTGRLRPVGATPGTGRKSETHPGGVRREGGHPLRALPGRGCVWAARVRGYRVAASGRPRGPPATISCPAGADCRGLTSRLRTARQRTLDLRPPSCYKATHAKGTAVVPRTAQAGIQFGLR